MQDLVTGISGGAQQSFTDEARARAIYNDFKERGLLQIKRGSQTDDVRFGPREYAKQ